MQECANRPVRQMDKNGNVRREIPPPLTAEQKRQKEQEEEKRKAEEAALAEQRQADRALLARYQSESDIEHTRKRALGMVKEHIKRESLALAAAEKSAKDAQIDNGKALSKASQLPSVERTLAEENQEIIEIIEIKKRIDNYKAEEARINSKYDAALKRYQELARQATATSMAVAK